MRCSLWLAGLACWACSSDVALAQNPSLFADPVRLELAGMGKFGLAIGLARDKAEEILQSENSCSAWFKQVDDDPAATFASLRFAIDPAGPRYILGWRTQNGITIFKHPYSASVFEYSGANSVVTLNGNGPFFVRSGPVYWEETGTFRRPIGWCVFQVGSYPGNTLAAQITTLLHEFGHVVGRIPEDTDELSGQSGRNTERVIHYCHAQIKAAERHSDRASR